MTWVAADCHEPASSLKGMLSLPNDLLAQISLLFAIILLFCKNVSSINARTVFKANLSA